MEEKREPESFMMRVARFIVNKRKAFIALFILACIYSVLSMSKVKVINDLTDYLPESTETRQGLDIMDEQFTTFGSAKIMVTNYLRKGIAVGKGDGEYQWHFCRGFL